MPLVLVLVVAVAICILSIASLSVRPQIDDNTYPNLMAILVGYNSSLAYNICEPRSPGKLEQCPFVWKDYRENGYVTAYGEDEASISSFNYHKFGFRINSG